MNFSEKNPKILYLKIKKAIPLRLFLKKEKRKFRMNQLKKFIKKETRKKMNLENIWLKCLEGEDGFVNYVTILTMRQGLSVIDAVF